MRLDPYMKFAASAVTTAVDVAEIATHPTPVTVVTASAAGINIGGLQNGAAGRVAILTIGSGSVTNTVQCDPESGAASAANRFVQTTLLGLGGVTQRMGTLQTYDAVSGRWRRAA
jgi:hypothetical protein